MGKNKTYDLEDQIARLEGQKKVLQARISDTANLQTEMVDFLTKYKAYLSSDGRKHQQELLLKIQIHIVQAQDQDSQASAPPPE